MPYAKPKHNYTANNITVLKGLEGVRKRPAMYIGDVDVTGLHHLVWEILDNAIDEALAGYCDYITITLHKDNSISIRDNGRGIPVDIHQETGLPAVQVVFTTLHAGGKFDHKAYSISGGLHGVGASVVNALSEWLTVEVYRDSRKYTQKYQQGKAVTDLKQTKTTEPNGTLVRFKPDSSIFKTCTFDFERIVNRARELSYLVPKITIELIDETTNRKIKFLSGGLLDFLVYLRHHELLAGPFILYTEIDNISLQLAFEYVNSYNEKLLSFVNTINTVDGGYHVTAFRSALTRAITQFNRENNITSYDISSELREGLNGVIHVLMPNPQFEGQTKNRLGNSEVRTILEPVIYQAIYNWCCQYPHYTKLIIQKAEASAKAKDIAKKAREVINKKSILQSETLAGKLTPCTSNNPEESELWIVEGESAAGTIKMARDRRTQAVLPLRGKILNIEKASLEKILDNEEIKSIFTAIGAGIGNDCHPSKSRYHKIIIATDADVDGKHIRTLLMTLFYKYMTCLIESGYIYLAVPPLYKIKTKRGIKYLTELPDKIEAQDVQRYKGLGEMNAEELYETILNPHNRLLKQLTIDDAKQAEQLFNILMGRNVEKRKEFIMEYASFSNIDI